MASCVAAPQVIFPMYRYISCNSRSKEQTCMSNLPFWATVVLDKEMALLLLYIPFNGVFIALFSSRSQNLCICPAPIVYSVQCTRTVGIKNSCCKDVHKNWVLTICWCIDIFVTFYSSNEVFISKQNLQFAITIFFLYSNIRRREPESISALEILKARSPHSLQHSLNGNKFVKFLVQFVS